MWETLLAGLLLQLIEKAGPVIIELIVKWLLSLNDADRKVALDGLAKVLSHKTA